ncbi:DNA invertase Pin-like site-specific DNA recombinase [Saccharopolyspora lacisalsi]|uniref:DNA invertase Pin-like site-specific DNA recombinase n=1 Tax=Halosaccharopolyspora lacisalsi TaxID=1000566 RepID=A0A839DWK0_9PSEU|nr:recombinase family protein [Halosaccharopolyspora lacisalsi]MBA8823827.1 DNA invertase Pin-like site-specific DNA recombinase [Halosaccharopolyspora lacisalsi]
MTTAHGQDGVDLLGGWTQRAPHRTRQQALDTGSVTGGVRFAFYGRTSTRKHQHYSTSAAWQREAAESVIADHGAITVEFFDTGCSRRLPWTRRPQAAALLATLDNEDPGFEAIVVGEYERAFTDSQFTRIIALLQHHNVQMWLPETGGPVNTSNPAHQALMTMLGAQSQREVLRARHRVLAAMSAQTRDQGRYLGGRPPYGYRLVDAGPHPNQAHARWGRRAQRLDPDPTTAPHVQWIFAQRLAGTSTASIARALNDQGIPCPSSADPDRNPHRTGEAWTLRTVAAILANPRYTGRQVWNRQRAHHAPTETETPLVHQWTVRRDWVVSKAATHPALVTEADFVAAQAIRAARPTSNGSTRTYLLAGLLQCGLCERRMDSHWTNHRPGYRCRHGHTSSQRRSPGQPKTLYRREDHLLDQLTAHLTSPDGTAVLHEEETRADDIVGYLRDNDLIIVCDEKGWAARSDPA